MMATPMLSAVFGALLCGLLVRVARGWSKRLLRDATCAYGGLSKVPRMRWAMPCFVVWFVSTTVALMLLLQDCPVTLVFWLAWLANLGLLGLIDARTGLLPNGLTLWMMLSGLAWQAGSTEGWLPPQNHLWGCVLGWAVPYGLNVAHERWRGTLALGEGDAKLMAGIGAWLGLDALPLVWLLACLAVLVYTAAEWAVERRRPLYVVFGPFLAFGASATMFMNHV